MNFYYHINSGDAIFIKEQEFFESQVSESKKENPKREWWKAWEFSNYSAEGIEHARLIIKTKLL